MEARTAQVVGPLPIVSVLIPAYNYAQGVVRILRPLLEEHRDDVEIIVHDDSTDDLVERAIAALGSAPSCLKYRRNLPRRGAVQNWNELLARARGRYVVLVHHDDLPLSRRFGFELVTELQRRGWPDALILRCVTHDVVRNRIKAGVPNRIRLLVARRWPMYLWLRNVIGPPAAVVLRRDLFDGYDPGLRWLVDVDAYYRFFARSPRRVEASPIVMVSSTGLTGAITTGIRDKGAIRHAELEYASSKFPRSSSWTIVTGSTAFGRFARKLEWILWAALKACGSACASLGRSRRVSITAIQQRIAQGASTGGSMRLGSESEP